MKNNRISKRYEDLIDAFELPKDILLGFPIVNMKGDRELVVSNHKGIRCYENDSIVLITKYYDLNISGRELYIKEYTKDTIILCGYINQVSVVK